jgi:hypothetical protein
MPTEPGHPQESPKKEKTMRNLSVLLLPAAALAILSVAPNSSFAANNPPRDDVQGGVAVVHQSEATNGCRPQYEIWSSHVKWVNDCASAAQPTYQVYGSHVTWQ